MGGASGGGGRATRALRLLLLLVLALAAVEYLFGGILESSPLKTYLYTPIYNATQPSIRIANKSVTWLKPTKENSTAPSHAKNVTKYNITFNATENKPQLLTPRLNNSSEMTVHSVRSASPAYNGTPLLIKKLIDKIKNFATTAEVRAEEVKKTEPTPLLCPKMPPDLGPVPVNKTDLELDFVEKKYPEIMWGGRYAPPNCTARHKVAIIVPYRDRQQHLAVFLNHMHPFLMKQQIEYGIFVIEQDGNKDFNRAKLMNVGFVESQRLDHDWQCFVFHDIDLLPLDTRNLYSCPRQPRHMSASIDAFNFRLPYEDIFGGVSAVTREQFKRVNGFSNRYWGWGGEDDDMFYRLKKSNYHVARYKMSIARYAMLDHKKSVPNPKRFNLLRNALRRFRVDGLYSLEYSLLQIVRNHLYTHILVNIDNFI